MDDVMNRLEHALSNALRQISAAAERGDLNTVEQQTKKASELRAMKDQVQAIKNRLRSFENGSLTGVVSAQTSSVVRELAVEVTQGMVNQNLLLLTEQKRRRLILSGERLNIEALPSGDHFETELLDSGRLHERGRIGKFYRDAGVRAGDIVLLREVTPGHWQLNKRT